MTEVLITRKKKIQNATKLPYISEFLSLAKEFLLPHLTFYKEDVIDLIVELATT